MKPRMYQKVVPSENVYEAVFAQQTSAYADCYRWALSDAQRRQWIAAPSPVLGGLRVFSCGTFIKASTHRWERSGLPEGILIYCVDGKGCYRQEGRQWEVQPGDLLYAPPRTHHSYWADGQTPWTIHWMHLSGELLPHYERLLGLVKRGPVRRIGVHADIIAEFTRLVRMQPPAGDATKLVLRANHRDGHSGANRRPAAQYLRHRHRVPVDSEIHHADEHLVGSALRLAAVRTRSRLRQPPFHAAI